MRILTVQPLGLRGGPSLQHLSFLRILAEAGLEVHAIVGQPPETIDRYRAVCASAVEVPLRTIIRSASPLRWAGYSRDVFAEARTIAERARTVKADVIYTCNDALPSSGIAARMVGIPSLYHVLGMTIFSPAAVGIVYGNALRSLADRVICCQRALYERFLGIGFPVAKLRVIYNSVDFLDIAERARRAPHARDPKTLRVGIVAGLDRRKGHARFIRAAAVVAAKRSDVRFFIVGNTATDAAYHRELRALVSSLGLEDVVTLTGAVDDPAPWIASFDVQCIPSDTEALSVAGVEAMVLGRAIVATRVGGNPEMLVDGVCGLLCDADDSGADLARAVLDLLADEGRRSALGKMARVCAEGRYDVRSNGRVLARTLQELVH